VTRRLLLSYLLLSVVVLVVLGVPLSIFYANQQQSHHVSDAREDALLLALAYERDLALGLPLDPASAEDYVARSHGEVVVVDRDGITRLDTANPIGRDLGDMPEIRQALAGIAAEPRHSSTRNVEYFALPITSEGTVHGALRLAVNHAPVNDTVRRFRLELTALAAAVLGVAALIGWGIARWISGPVRRLTAEAERFAAGDLEIRPATPSGPPEVQALTKAMEKMAAQLGELLRSQRRFVADASHQLRTPLTALRLRLENAMDAPEEERRAELETAIEETERVTGLVTDLLVLARADDHRPHTADTDAVTDLPATVRDRVDTWSAVADNVDVRLVCHVPAGALYVRADPAAVEQIIDNLLDNALHAAPPDTTITARVERVADALRMTILDEGTGLSDEEKQLATQRFWRGDKSRPGTGLGLSIVDSLATSWDARFTLSDAPGGGLAATVTFLRAAARPAAAAGPEAARSPVAAATGADR
jgi:signal transduction histidine kinase